MGNLSSKQDYKNAVIGFSIMTIIGLVMLVGGIARREFASGKVMMIFGFLIFIPGVVCLGIYAKKYNDSSSDIVPVDCSVNYSDWGTCTQQPDGTWSQFSQGTIVHGTNGGKDNCDSTQKSRPCVPTVVENKEVFNIWSQDYPKADAAGVCKALGSELATEGQVSNSFSANASWCSLGWVSDNDQTVWPNRRAVDGECGPANSIVKYTPPSGKAGVNCYGVKPLRTANIPGLTEFNDVVHKWSQYDP
jgi:hypothetical protein